MYIYVYICIYMYIYICMYIFMEKGSWFNRKMDRVSEREERLGDQKGYGKETWREWTPLSVSNPISFTCHGLALKARGLLGHSLLGSRVKTKRRFLSLLIHSILDSIVKTKKKKSHGICRASSAILSQQNNIQAVPEIVQNYRIRSYYQ